MTRPLHPAIRDSQARARYRRIKPQQDRSPTLELTEGSARVIDCDNLRTVKVEKH